MARVFRPEIESDDDPFGQPVSITGPVEQNLRFPGQYFLIETGLSYNWHRFYDPATGRYTQPDPLRFVDGPSVYGYAGQSPMMRVDPEGLSSGGVPQFICYVLPSLCGNKCSVGDSPYTPTIPPLPIKPPDNAWDPNGPKAPGYPGDVSPDRPGGYPGGIPGYEDPKGGPDWVPNPNGRGYGWRSKDGKVWVPTGHDGDAHAGPHWDVQDKRKGDRENVFPPLPPKKPAPE